MDKWSFNMLLFSRLPKVLDISEAEIARRCGLTQQVLNRYTNNEIVLSVQALIKICNSLRMPAYFFVSENNNHVFPNRECATVPLDQWHPVEWNTQAVELTFGDGEGRIYWKDVAVAMNVSSQKPHERFLLRKRFPIDGFLKACSHFDISPFTFLSDPNREVEKQKTSKRKANVPNSSLAGNEAALRADIAVLTKELDKTNTTVAELVARYDNLLQRHNALLAKHNELERKVYDFVGYDRLLMAADESNFDK